MWAAPIHSGEVWSGLLSLKYFLSSKAMLKQYDSLPSKDLFNRQRGLMDIFVCLLEKLLRLGCGQTMKQIRFPLSEGPKLTKLTHDQFESIFYGLLNRKYNSWLSGKLPLMSLLSCFVVLGPDWSLQLESASPHFSMQGMKKFLNEL